MLEKSWSEVSVTTIENCFRKTGFSFGSIVEESIECQDINWSQMTNNLEISGLQLDDLVTADNNVVSGQQFGQNYDINRSIFCGRDHRL